MEQTIVRWVALGVLVLVVATGCGGKVTSDDAGRPDGAPDGAEQSDPGADPGPDEGADWGPGDQGPTCPVDPCVEVTAFPFVHEGNTADSSLRQFDSYACAPTVPETGPEVVYQLVITEPGTLIAMIEDDFEAGVDVDVQLLDALDADACLRRGHIGLSHHLAAGTTYLIVDSWSDAGGVAYPGPYRLHLHFLPDASPCAMLGAPIDRVGEDAPFAMPATGPVVLEAHLVTAEEFTDGSWPQSFTDGIAAHYALSEATTGYAMSRGEPWCPCCEPTNEYGQGSSIRPPVAAETFYLNMRWASSPGRGARYLVYNGLTGAAVVTAAGYENGPGDLANIGGTAEEVHHHLGTGHLSVLTFGVAADQALPYGPLDCPER